MIKLIVINISIGILFGFGVTPYVVFSMNSDSELYAIKNQSLNHLNIGIDIKHTPCQGGGGVNIMNFQ